MNYARGRFESGSPRVYAPLRFASFTISKNNS